MEAQKKLQEEVFGHDFASMSTEDRIEFITWNILAATDELHEALNEVGWKPWASSKHINTESFKSELIDVYHFLMNLFIVAGMDEDEVKAAYFAKRAKNVKRHEVGYDGVNGKCGWCKRSYDDDGVACRPPREGSFTAYCGKNHAEFSTR